MVAKPEPGVPRSLSLMAGIPVIAIKNNGARGLINGLRGIVVGFQASNLRSKLKRRRSSGVPPPLPVLAIETGVSSEEFPRLPVVQFYKCSGDNMHGPQRLVHPELFDAMDDRDGLVAQFPLRLSYAVTVHRVQGLTLDKVDVDLSGFWEDGQAYVAVTRVRNSGSLRIANWSEASLKVSCFFFFLVSYNHCEYSDTIPARPTKMRFGITRSSTWVC